MQAKSNILAFDTSAAHCAAALLCDQTLVSERCEAMAKGQAEHLMPLLEELLRDARLNWRDLDAIGVGVGPGNFTGLRISVSAARGLAMGLNIPAVGVPCLEAQGFLGGDETPVISVSAAPRDQYYADLIQDGQGRGPKLLADNALPSYPTRAEPYVLGHRAEELGAMHGLQVIKPAFPLAEGIARLAMRRMRSTTDRPKPLYVRAADAAPPRDPAPVILP
ncbi:tRNA (adenosine(37)-N6)-threonylcarbamoyltransferase complex dimerization subunit type 1 TsaB [Pseudaestuariivita rosea]|uniref:tRNA (adenosine(37)-N6)-threonylcarbamoyltransferase complex dimerization subunit type 1 TsaB n=1 Tax=Pseudaestuariivita rosea TaxID=2763263 RepID=UPI001ABB7234|nr:tRNA (adenosine(37)-N6)-threonylcarbamoyltransferase complex dimerization subunit type 1 TsaB [Pseudaestuariivita rosea]